MTVSRDTTPATYEDLLDLWRDSRPPVGRAVRRARASRLMLLAYVVMAAAMLTTYATLLWVIDVVGR